MATQAFYLSGAPPLKTEAQFRQEADGLAGADDLVGLIGLCDYLIAHWEQYPVESYEQMLAHLGAIAQARRQRKNRSWRDWLN